MVLAAQVEAQAAKGAYRAAEAALHSGGKRCPAFAGSSEFALLQKALDKQMAAAGGLWHHSFSGPPSMYCLQYLVNTQCKSNDNMQMSCSFNSST